jgi:hypothetical protein
MTRSVEPCLCGDPYCRRCFPTSPDGEWNHEPIENLEGPDEFGDDGE